MCGRFFIRYIGKSSGTQQTPRIANIFASSSHKKKRKSKLCVVCDSID